MKPQLAAKYLKDLKILNSVSEEFKFNTTFDDYIAEITKISSEFENRFQDFKKIEPILEFILFPFGNQNFEEMSVKISDFSIIDSSKIEQK